MRDRPRHPARERSALPCQSVRYRPRCAVTTGDGVVGVGRSSRAGMRRTMISAGILAVALCGLTVGGRGLSPGAVQERLRVTALPLWAETIPDVPYGPHEENRLDILRPRWRGPALRGGVIVLHGGGWRHGTRQQMRDRVCRRYLERDFLVANVDYRRGAEPAADDAVRALEWFSARAASYGVDPQKIVLMGESAGAHLALVAAFRSRVRPAAVVSFSGISDLQALVHTSFVREALPAQGWESAAQRLSPLAHVRGGLPPVLSVHGTADPLVPPDQAARLTSAIRAAGGEAADLFIDGGGHGFTEAQLEMAYRAVFDFLTRHGM